MYNQESHCIATRTPDWAWGWRGGAGRRLGLLVPMGRGGTWWGRSHCRCCSKHPGGGTSPPSPMGHARWLCWRLCGRTAAINTKAKKIHAGGSPSRPPPRPPQLLRGLLLPRSTESVGWIGSKVPITKLKELVWGLGVLTDPSPPPPPSALCPPLKDSPPSISQPGRRSRVPPGLAALCLE